MERTIHKKYKNFFKPLKEIVRTLLTAPIKLFAALQCDFAQACEQDLGKLDGFRGIFQPATSAARKATQYSTAQ
ncbi:MAG: hypothetical protein NZM43_02815 [Saprospiraceae bacterium]|nr:hypothetical protein [Saprospiraceae bacterium]MDW8483234.1 hypothetical protein [Saprospiraceae bacterium]